MKPMKTSRITIIFLAIAAGIFASVSLAANEAHKSANSSVKPEAGQLVPASDLDAAWLAKAREEYPLKSCVISGDEFDGGPMGKPIDFAFRKEGQPDRLVRFCCKDCIKDFNKDPERHLDEIAAAAKAAKKG